MDVSKILMHPDKDQIISDLVDGKSPKDVAQALKIKYNSSEQQHLCLGAGVLKEFIDKHLNIYEQLEKDLETVEKGLVNSKQSESIKNNQTYKKRLEELADKEVDIKTTIQRSVQLIEQRLEQVFDKIQENPGDFKGDHILLKYIETLNTAVEKCDKIINNKPDQVIQHNITVQMLESQTIIFQEAVRELLMEMDPQLANQFLESFTAKMEQLKAPTIEKTFISQDKRLSQAKLLGKTTEAKIVEEDEGE